MMRDTGQQHDGLRKRTDFVSASLEGFWDDVPRVAGEIDDWHGLDQLDYTSDVVATAWKDMAELNQYATKGLLTKEQLKALAKIRALAKKRQPLLDRILAG
jgi:hypothetical protein